MLMIAIFLVAMIRLFTSPVIGPVAGNDKQNCRDEETEQIGMKILLQNQQRNARREEYYWINFVMMFFVTMPKRIKPYSEGQYDHQQFETYIVDDIDAEKGKAGKHQRKHSAVYGACH
jgi:hypothetical protein